MLNSGGASWNHGTSSMFKSHGASWNDGASSMFKSRGVSWNDGASKMFGVQHEQPDTTVSTLFQADLQDSNSEISCMFKSRINSMNRRLSYFNYEKKILKELDLFVLDNSLRETTVGHVRGHTLEKKWEIYNEVKKVGFKYIVVASFNHMTRTGEHFLRDLKDKGEDMSAYFAFVEFIDICRENNVPKTELPMGLKKCKQFGIHNVVIEVDLVYHGIDYRRFNAQQVCSLLSERFKWIRQNLCTDSLIIVNIRDFSECMKSHPTRVFCLVNYLASFPENERIFGIAYEDGGKYYSEQLAVWTFCVREEMNRFGWYDGHLLVNIHEQYGVCNGTQLDCLADGATGIWAGICEEGAAMGHASSCLTIMNLIRLGNTKVLQKYKCNQLRSASRAITNITTGHPPYPRQPVTGDRSLGIYFGLEPMNHCAVENVVDFDESTETELRITSQSPSRKIITKLALTFGTDNNFNEERAEKMKEIMLHDVEMKKKEDYDSSVGLALLYERSGGNLTSAMTNAIQRKKRKSSQLKALISEIRKMWDEWNVQDEIQGDELDFFAFYNGFMSPYFASCRNNETSRLLEAISMQKAGKVDWNEFLVHLQWAGNQYPETATSEELLNIAFRKRIISAMQEQFITNVQGHHYNEVQSEAFYTDYEYKHDMFFTATDTGIGEDMILEEVVPVEESGQDEDDYFAMLDQMDNNNEHVHTHNTLKYEVHIKTGDATDAGTDATAYIILFGEKGCTGKIEVKSFKANHDNQYNVVAYDVGKITKIRIGRDYTYDFTSWHITGVFINIPAFRSQFNFSADRWLGINSGVYALDVDLYLNEQDDKVKYEIHLVTGEVPDAATNANAYIMLFGDKGHTGKFPLKRFKEKHDNLFIIEANDLGKIKKIRVGHDVKADYASWHLVNAFVEIPACSSKVYFPADRWLGTKGYVWTLDVDLYPKREDKNVTYDITVKTGNVPGEGSSADAYIILFGENGDTGKYPLKRLKQKHDNLFTVEAIDVGKITRIRIGHEFAADFECWHLTGVLINIPVHGSAFNITANRWLGTKGGPCTLDVDVFPKEEGYNIKYEIYMKTGDVPDAGTDANAYIIIFGETTHTGKLPLKEMKENHDNHVTVLAINVGQIRKIRIGNENKADIVCWHLAEVFINIPDHGSRLNFPANRQLGTKGGIGTLDVDLYPKQKVLGNEVSYEICVKTCDVPDYGTDANAYIILFGRKRDTGKLALKTLKNHCENLFTIEAIDVGKISHIKIGHESTADFTSWHLSEVFIHIPARGTTMQFPAGRQLGTKGGDWTLDVELFPKKEADKINYEIQVKTGYVADDVNAYITLFGEKGETGKCPLNRFRKHYNNLFTVKAPDVGKITKIRIGHEDNIASWHLVNVFVDIPSHGCELNFPANRHLGEKNGVTVADLDLYPKKEDDKVKYEIHIHTNDVPDAGTNANAFIIVFGKKGHTGKLPLTTFKSNHDNLFAVEGVDVGKVRKIRIGHELKANFASWHLARVVVNIPACGTELNFPANRWLGTKGQNAWTLDVDLYPEERGDVHYEIHMKTGEVTDAGNHANAYIILFGAKRHTGKLPLMKVEEHHDNVYQVKAPDVGRITKIRIGHDKKADFGRWHLDGVFINIVEHDSKSTFGANRQLGTKGADVSLHLDLYPKEKGAEIKYELLVKTGDVPDAGSNANAYIILFGDQGHTGKLPLKTFHENHDNLFTVEAIDVGKISKIRIGHDVIADFTCWHLSDVYLNIPAHASKFTFPAHRQLGTKGGEWTLDVDLYPIEKDDEVKYEVHIQTGDVPDAGKHANAYIILYGEKIHTGKFPLKTLNENCDNMFILEAVDVGEIQKIRVGHDIRADFESWYLSDVFINIPARESRFNFHAAKDRRLGTKGVLWTLDVDLHLKDKVFSLTEEAPLIEVAEDILIEEVATVEESGGDEDNYLDFLDQMDEVNIESTMNEQSNYIVYEICVKTGDVAGAGTDANVFITFYGDNGDTGPIVLDHSKTGNQNIFERNHEDIFTVMAVDVGHVSKIRIGHDNNGSCTGWYLDMVEVDIPSHNDNLKFSARRWLSKTEHDKQIEVDLYPSDGDPVYIKDQRITYEITVKTGDCYGAGTDANVYIRLFGDKGDTGVIDLDTPAGEGKSMFERSYTDLFIVEAVDVGTITSVRIGHDNKGGFAGWYLDWVDVKAQDYHVMLKADRWLDKTEGDKKLEVELYPPAKEEPVESVTFHVKDTMHPIDTKVKEPVKINIRTAHKRTYVIHVKTGDIRFAGTDASVFITLYGEHGITNKIVLDKSTTYTNSFERNQIDIFTVEELDVGNLLKIRIGHDGTGAGAGWYLGDVVVETPGMKRKWIFLANRWLDRKTGDGKIEVDLFPSP